MADRKPDMDVSVQQGLRELMQDDYSLLLETFVADAGHRMRQMHDALGASDLDAFRQAAHSFKGSCGNMGALALEQACLEAEGAGVAGDSQAAHAHLATIEQAFERLKPLLG